MVEVFSDLDDSLQVFPKEHQARRIRHIIFAIEIGLLVLIAVNLRFSADLEVSVVLAVTSLILLFNLVLLQRGYSKLASYLLLWILTIMCSFLMWRNGGLRDTSLLGFPAILFFAAILGNRNLFYLLFFSILGFMVLLGVSTVLGFKTYDNLVMTWDNVSDTLVLMGLVGFSMKLLSDDLREVLRGLRIENQRYKVAQDEALFLSRHDGLTRLPNRLMGEDRFNQAVTRAQRSNSKVAVLFLDIDRFKTFNDSLGHAAGDRLICEIGKRLGSTVRASDTVCRYGGDEFIVLLDSIPKGEVAERSAREILDAVLQPLNLDGHNLELSASIGVAIAPDDGTDYNSVCRKADMAMYKAKEMGGNSVRFFDEEMNIESAARMAMIGGLTHAIKNNELCLEFQPQINLETGQIIGAEALLRWDRPGIGTIMPDQFIPIAEETDLIQEIGQWVIREACIECCKWHAAGFEGIKIAVNVSPAQLGRELLLQQLQQALIDSGLKPHFLQLELTESVILDSSPKINAELRSINKMGVKLAIDDFGTGYSNLGYLSRMRSGCIKIDRTFVKDMRTSERGVTVVSAIIQLAHSLNLSTTVEGVEDAESLRQLKALGCLVGQGYYWSRPLRSDAFFEYLSRSGESAVLASSEYAETA